MDGLGESMAEGTPVRVWKLNKSGGVVERSPEFRRKSRDNKIKEYFYGTPGAELQPHSQTLPFGQVSIFKVGGGPRAPTTALPIGQQSSSDPDQHYFGKGSHEGKEDKGNWKIQ